MPTLRFTCPYQLYCGVYDLAIDMTLKVTEDALVVYTWLHG